MELFTTALVVVVITISGATQTILYTFAVEFALTLEFSERHIWAERLSITAHANF
jgi:hypothetical protein